jgi:hypothetical protein
MNRKNSANPLQCSDYGRIGYETAVSQRNLKNFWYSGCKSELRNVKSGAPLGRYDQELHFFCRGGGIARTLMREGDKSSFQLGWTQICKKEKKKKKDQGQNMVNWGKNRNRQTDPFQAKECNVRVRQSRACAAVQAMEWGCSCLGNEEMLHALLCQGSEKVLKMNFSEMLWPVYHDTHITFWALSAMKAPDLIRSCSA